MKTRLKIQHTLNQLAFVLALDFSCKFQYPHEVQWSVVTPACPPAQCFIPCAACRDAWQRCQAFLVVAQEGLCVAVQFRSEKLAIIWTCSVSSLSAPPTEGQGLQPFLWKARRLALEVDPHFPGRAACRACAAHTQPFRGADQMWISQVCDRWSEGLRATLQCHREAVS